MLCCLHYSLSEDKRTAMLAVCSSLTERLGELPIESWYMEIVSVLRIQFLIKVSRREVNHHAVRAHFEKCLQLLARHSSHQDAYNTLKVLGERLRYFQQF